MRFSKAFIPTLREVPAEAEIVSHKLMMRAGMIRQVARGIYDYLPLGWRVLKKVIHIAREELDVAGCQEVQLPLIIPAELWQESGRWDRYGRELLRLKDRSDRDFCVGPTHEEVITDMVRGGVRSYRQLPLNLYQIHTKFRDEIRPRFGLMRGREFLMHDGYSFHASDDDLDKHYALMRETYERIFSSCGLKCRVVEAATGAIGGSSSHEVMVLAETGESAIAVCEKCGYSANVDLAESRKANIPSPPAGERATCPPVLWRRVRGPQGSPQQVHTPSLRAIEEVAPFLGIDPSQMIKTILYLRDGGVVVALVTGDAEINETKLQTAVGAAFLTMLDPNGVRQVTGADIGFAGPVELPKEVKGLGAVTVAADPAVMSLTCGATGANKTDYHLTDVVPGRDFTPDTVCDLALACAGDGCPRCDKGVLGIVRGIEVGHIFKLGTKYSSAMKATFLDEHGKEQPLIMGTYGLGIGRTAAAAVEQNHDDKGIIWPMPIAPYHAHLMVLKARDEKHVVFGGEVYDAFSRAGVEVLYDDRDERAGVKFADADLIGMPYQAIVGERGLKEKKVEMKDRRTGQATMFDIEGAIAMLREAVGL